MADESRAQAAEVDERAFRPDLRGASAVLAAPQIAPGVGRFSLDGDDSPGRPGSG